MSLTQNRINELVALQQGLILQRHEREHGPRTTPVDFRFENKAAKQSSIYVYDDIAPWGITSRDFVATLNQIPQDHDIELHINSGGGSVFEGMAIYNAMKKRASKTKSYVDGVAASAASFIAMAASEVIMSEASTMMIHGASGLTIGNAQDHRDTAELLDMLSDQIAGIYANKTGTSKADWMALMSSDKWYTAQEAVQSKLADKVDGAAEPSPSNTLDLSGLLNLFESDSITVHLDNSTGTFTPSNNSALDFDGLRNALKGVFK